MSRQSINANMQCALPTLADVYALISKDPKGLTPRGLKDRLSSLRRVAHLLHQPLDKIPADVPTLRKRIDSIDLNQANLSKTTMQPMRSLFFSAIAVSGLVPIVRTSKSNMSSDWTALLDETNDKKFQTGLSRFARFCSSQNLAPLHVGQSHFEAFEAMLNTQSAIKDPRATFVSTTRVWNKLCGLPVGSGLKPVVRVLAAAHRVYWEDLSKSLVHDYEKYEKWLKQEDLFAENSRDKALSGTTIRLRRDQFLCVMTAIRDGGHDIKPISSLKDLVKPCTVKIAMRQRLAEVDGKPNRFNEQLMVFIIGLAREWVEVDEPHLKELKRIGSKLPKVLEGLTPKNTKFLREFSNSDAISRLYRFPKREFNAALKLPYSFRSLSRAQGSLAVAILSYAPMRISNLLCLDLGRTIFLPNDAGKSAVINIPREEVKNKQPLMYELPSDVTQMLLAYREWLAKHSELSPPVSLFVNVDGKRLSIKGLGRLITKTTNKHSGIQQTPHQFRHAAGLITLEADPGAFETVRQLLGHTNTRVTVSAYAGISTQRASKHHAELIQRKISEKIKI